MNHTDQTARTLIDQAAALAGMTTEPIPHHTDHETGEPYPLPCIATDPATGRRLHVRRITYPASQAGRLSMSPDWPRDSTGRSHTPRTETPAATVAPTTEPAALARRLRRYLDETADAYKKAQDIATNYSDHEAKTQATKVALVAAGWTDGRHGMTPPSIPSSAYIRAETVSGDSVGFHLGGLTTAQAVTITRLLVDGLNPLHHLLDLAAAQLDQSATHDGLTNAAAIAAARRFLD